MHISLSLEIKNKLKAFAKNRKKSQTAIIEYALEQLFSVEHIDPAVEIGLREAITRHLQIPPGHTLRSFWITLYQLGKHLPQGNPRELWGAGIYHSQVELTNAELLTLITEQWQKNKK